MLLPYLTKYFAVYNLLVNTDEEVHEWLFSKYRKKQFVHSYYAHFNARQLDTLKTMNCLPVNRVFML